LLIHPHDHRYFAFGKQQNLEHKMIAFIGAFGQARLSHKNEARKEDGFEGHNRIERCEGCRVEVRDSADVDCVYEHPRNKDSKMDQNKSEVAGKSRYRVTNLIRAGTFRIKLLLVSGYRLYVFLNMIGYLHEPFDANI